MYCNEEKITVLLLIGMLFILHIIVLACLYVNDKRIKAMLSSGIKQIELLSLTKQKYFFVYYKRKEGFISKHAFISMIVYYILNFAGFVALFIQFITGNNSPLLTTCGILIFLNIGLIFLVSVHPAITDEQKMELDEYMDKERWRQEDERKKRRHS